jgi:ABC-type uncharacterized transport system YnjBCD ATPase subunit
VTPARRRYLLLDLASRHIDLARGGARQLLGALRDAAICALLATRDSDDISVPGALVDEPLDGDPRYTGPGGSA